MRAVILIDNLACGTLAAEWGLSIYIEYEGHKLLLDTGASERFARNAEALGVDLGAVELGVLSHAHNDHANGLAAFFAHNASAPFYLREGTRENCYGKRWIFHKYGGIRRGFLQKYEDRLIYTGDRCEIRPGITLLAHSTKGLEEYGRKNYLYIRKNGRFLPDSFAHEQTLIFDTERGLAVFSSCSHAGADNIVQEVLDAFPGKNVYALVGGFHLYHTAPEDMRAFANRLRATGVEKIYTGHCTGEAAFRILREELGEQVVQLRTGMEIEL